MAFYKCGRIYTTSNSRVDIDTKSGSVARFNTSLAMPVLGCNAEFSASQAEGTPTPSTPIPIVGVDKVLITDCGKNLLPSLLSAVTVNNITFSPLSDGAIDIDGTASGNASVDAGRNEGVFLKAGTYYVNVTTTPFTITVFGIVNGTVTTIKSGGGLFTLTKPTQIFVRVFIANGTTVNHLRLPLQLELGSTATEFEPYNGTTVIINLGGTYYGGEVDAVMGKIPLTHQLYNTLGDNISNVVKDSSSWRVYYSSAVYGTDNQYKEGLCDKLGFKTSYSGVNGNNNSIGFPSSAGTQILIRNDALTSAQEVRDFMPTLNAVYPLATPIVVYASNTAELYTKAGLNNIFCDTGDIEVKYRKLHSDN